MSNHNRFIQCGNLIAVNTNNEISHDFERKGTDYRLNTTTLLNNKSNQNNINYAKSKAQNINSYSTNPNLILVNTNDESNLNSLEISRVTDKNVVFEQTEKHKKTSYNTTHVERLFSPLPVSKDYENEKEFDNTSICAFKEAENSVDNALTSNKLLEVGLLTEDDMVREKFYEDMNSLELDSTPEINIDYILNGIDVDEIIKTLYEPDISDNANSSEVIYISDSEEEKFDRLNLKHDYFKKSNNNEHSQTDNDIKQTENNILEKKITTIRSSPEFIANSKISLENNNETLIEELTVDRDKCKNKVNSIKNSFKQDRKRKEGKQNKEKTELKCLKEKLNLEKNNRSKFCENLEYIKKNSKMSLENKNNICKNKDKPCYDELLKAKSISLDTVHKNNKSTVIQKVIPTKTNKKNSQSKNEIKSLRKMSENKHSQNSLTKNIRKKEQNSKNIKNTKISTVSNETYLKREIDISRNLKIDISLKNSNINANLNNGETLKHGAIINSRLSIKNFVIPKLKKKCIINNYENITSKNNNESKACPKESHQGKLSVKQTNTCHNKKVKTGAEHLLLPDQGLKSLKRSMNNSMEVINLKKKRLDHLNGDTSIQCGTSTDNITKKLSTVKKTVDDQYKKETTEYCELSLIKQEIMQMTTFSNPTPDINDLNAKKALHTEKILKIDKNKIDRHDKIQNKETSTFSDTIKRKQPTAYFDTKELKNVDQSNNPGIKLYNIQNEKLSALLTTIKRKKLKTAADKKEKESSISNKPHDVVQKIKCKETSTIPGTKNINKIAAASHKKEKKTQNLTQSDNAIISSCKENTKKVVITARKSKYNKTESIKLNIGEKRAEKRVKVSTALNKVTENKLNVRKKHISQKVEPKIYDSKTEQKANDKIHLFLPKTEEKQNVPNNKQKQSESNKVTMYYNVDKIVARKSNCSRNHIPNKKMEADEIHTKKVTSHIAVNKPHDINLAPLDSLDINKGIIKGKCSRLEENFTTKDKLLKIGTRGSKVTNNRRINSKKSNHLKITKSLSASINSSNNLNSWRHEDKNIIQESSTQNKEILMPHLQKDLLALELNMETKLIDVPDDRLKEVGHLESGPKQISENVVVTNESIKIDICSGNKTSNKNIKPACKSAEDKPEINKLYSSVSVKIYNEPVMKNICKIETVVQRESSIITEKIENKVNNISHKTINPRKSPIEARFNHQTSVECSNLEKESENRERGPQQISDKGNAIKEITKINICSADRTSNRNIDPEYKVNEDKPKNVKVCSDVSVTEYSQSIVEYICKTENTLERESSKNTKIQCENKWNVISREEINSLKLPMELNTNHQSSVDSNNPLTLKQDMKNECNTLSGDEISEKSSMIEIIISERSHKSNMLTKLHPTKAEPIISYENSNSTNNKVTCAEENIATENKQPSRNRQNDVEIKSCPKNVDMDINSHAENHCINDDKNLASELLQGNEQVSKLKNQSSEKENCIEKIVQMEQILYGQKLMQDDNSSVVTGKETKLSITPKNLPLYYESGTLNKKEKKSPVDEVNLKKIPSEETQNKDKNTSEILNIIEKQSNNHPLLKNSIMEKEQIQLQSKKIKYSEIEQNNISKQSCNTKKIMELNQSSVDKTIENFNPPEQVQTEFISNKNIEDVCIVENNNNLHAHVTRNNSEETKKLEKKSSQKNIRFQTNTIKQFNLTKHYLAKPYWHFYEMESILRNGYHSCIIKTRNKATNKTIAIKVLHAKFLSYHENYIEILKLIKDSDAKGLFHCIGIEDIMVSHLERCIVMEYCPHNLTQFLNSLECGLNMQKVQIFSRQLMNALMLLRIKEILHRAIKPEHILVSSDGTVIKLGGFDRSIKANNAKTTFCIHPLNYLAPEILIGTESSYSADLWAAACVMYKMATDKVLFEGRDPSTVIANMILIGGDFCQDTIKKGKYSHLYFEMESNKVMLLSKTAGPSEMKSSDKMKIIDKIREVKKPKGDDEEEKIMMFSSLLESMLALDPKRRETVELAYVHPFIYQWF